MMKSVSWDCSYAAAGQASPGCPKIIIICQRPESLILFISRSKKLTDRIRNNAAVPWLKIHHSFFNAKFISFNGKSSILQPKLMIFTPKLIILMQNHNVARGRGAKLVAPKSSVFQRAESLLFYRRIQDFSFLIQNSEFSHRRRRRRRQRCCLVIAAKLIILNTKLIIV